MFFVNHLNGTYAEVDIIEQSEQTRSAKVLMGGDEFYLPTEALEDFAPAGYVNDPAKVVLG